jgi:hypothetical protein
MEMKLQVIDCFYMIVNNRLFITDYFVVLFLQLLKKSDLIMETKHIKQLTEFLESMNRINKFSTLKPENKSDNLFGIKLKVSGYNELNLMVSDLLKSSIILMNKEARSLANFESDTDINVVTLLEIALQLLPDQEMELLDDLHKISLESYTV